MYKLDPQKLEHSPRAVRFWECCLAVFYENLSKIKRRTLVSKKSIAQVNINQFIEDEEQSRFYLDKAFEIFQLANRNHLPVYELSENLKDEFYIRNVKPKAGENQPDSVATQEFIVNSATALSKPKIAVANTKVLEANIKASMRGKPNYDGRFNTLYKIFKQTREEKADILLLPECFMPIAFLDRIVWYAVKEQKMVVTGIEHVTLDKLSFNFIVTILPFEWNGIKDAVVVYRLKNHYSHAERLMIETNHFKVPIPSQYIYDLFIWKGIYFSPYYCFELADISHRSIFKSQIDLLIASEWNPDVNYFSNIVESISRDIHVYVAQVNTSQYGDTRITRPSKTDMKDILKLKGGDNDTILVGEINLDSLREFQRELYAKTKDDKMFKPLPPDFPLQNVMKRINNMPMF